MTGYLLDENVFRELRVGGNANVRAWRQSVNQATLCISVITYFEKRRGWERRRKRNTAVVETRLAELDALALAYGSRLLPIDGPIAAEWARLVGAKDKDRFDRALVATARVRDLVLATRNVADMRGCDVRVVDPFRKNPAIEIV